VCGSLGLGFRVLNSGFRVLVPGPTESLGFKVWGLEFASFLNTRVKARPQSWDLKP